MEKGAKENERLNNVSMMALASTRYTVLKTTLQHHQLHQKQR